MCEESLRRSRSRRPDKDDQDQHYRDVVLFTLSILGLIVLGILLNLATGGVFLT